MNKKLMLNNAQLLDLVRNELSEGGSVKIKARGNSMRPLIQGNRDELVLCKPNEDSFKKGSIVLARLQEEHMVAHRIAVTDGNTLVLRGDGNIAARETVKPKDVVAEVIAVVRGRKIIRKGSFCWNKYRYLWPSNPLLRRVLLKLPAGKQD
jgi:hypothetical protein